MQKIITKLSEKQLHGLYAQGNRRQYGDEGVDEIVERIVEYSREDAPIEAYMAELRRLASSSDSFQDFSDAVQDIKSKIS